MLSKSWFLAGTLANSSIKAPPRPSKSDLAPPRGDGWKQRCSRAAAG